MSPKRPHLNGSDVQFWELDTDHDFVISKEDLIRYGNHSLTYRIIDRIFQQVCYVFLHLSANLLLTMSPCGFWAS